MKAIDLPPLASTLLESMRAVGYSFKTAVADILDNSIAAGATQIEVHFSPFADPYVAVLDDGCGMDAEELRAAMRHGSRTPLAKRPEHDLGRFGLGLKTASLSQCRCLTVISRKSGRTAGARWDLDEVAKRESWSLLELDAEDIAQLPLADSLQSTTHGTLVLWERLDRIEAGEKDLSRALQDRIDEAREHLALVFHRFLEPVSAPEVVIRINRNPVIPVDPYLRTVKGGKGLPQERIEVEGYEVSIEPWILPHVSRMSREQIELAGGDAGLRRNQGFYVYRNRRLITWGTWFRLAKQEEMTKLARVIVDIPNALDHLWALDVKKSTAHPPQTIRDALRRIIGRIADSSRRVYVHKGWKETQPGAIHAWDRMELRDGRIVFKVNREHPLFKTVREAVPDDQGRLLERFLQVIEQSYPRDALYADMAAERTVAPGDQKEDVEERLLDTGTLMLESLQSTGEEIGKILDCLHIMDPFATYPEVVRQLREKFA